VRLLSEDPAEANAAQDRADVAAAAADDPRLLALFALRRAQNRAAAGRQDEAVAAAEQARAFYREHGPADRAAVASILCGQLADDPVVAMTAFDEALAMSAEVGPALSARLGRGRALVRLERAAEAISDLVEAVAMCAEHGLDDGGAFARQDLANAYRVADRQVEAAEVAEEALAGFERLGLDDPANDTRLMLAGLYRMLDSHAEALEIYAGLRERLADNPAGRGQVAEQHGQLLFELDRDAEAAEVFGAAAGDLRTAGDELGELRLLRRRLVALSYAGAMDQAEETIRAGQDRFAGLSSESAARPEATWSRAMFGYEAARLLIGADRHEEALPYLVDQPGRLRAIGSADDADRVEGLYAEALESLGRSADGAALSDPTLNDR
jgi:tetratricopeptide (TPR) repeat protein